MHKNYYILTLLSVLALQASAQTAGTDSLSISGAVHYTVDNTELMEGFMTNQRGLDSIVSTLRRVEGDTLNTLTHLHLHGYASPEAPYSRNQRLAAGRARSLSQYIINHTNLDPRLISTASTPEDWQGLRSFVSADTLHLGHRTALLQLIDQPMDPDRRLTLIRSRYPADYAYLLAHCFPLLRRTDFSLSYLRRQLPPVVIEPEPEPEPVVIVEPEPEPIDTPVVILPEEPFRPLLALKTNVLFDLLLAFNAEVELPLDRRADWSLMAEYWKPWYVWHQNSRAYELQVIGLELRRWLSPRERRTALGGVFSGLYFAVGKYDFEWSSEGDQGEFLSAGLSAGYSWRLSDRWHLEASGALGAVWGTRSHYNGRFNDTHLIWDHDAHQFYFGPTKAKISLVWLIPTKKKGGRL